LQAVCRWATPFAAQDAFALAGWTFPPSCVGPPEREKEVGLRYYLLRRLLLIIPVLIGLSIVTFVISHMVPGDPIRLAAGPQATAEQIHKLQEEFGLDKPLPVQYPTT
jgi:hypothetical protein